MNRTVIQGIALVIGLVVAIASFNLLKGCDPGSSSGHAKKIGQITELIGQVERRQQGAAKTETVPDPRPLYNQDLIITHKASKATIYLEPDGPTLRMNENSRFVVETDLSRQGSALIGTLLDGTLTVLSPARKPNFRLFQNGREIQLENAEKRPIPVIPDVAANTSPQTDISPTPESSPMGIIISATQADETLPNATPGSQSATPAVAIEESSEILTNEEIVKTLKSQTGLFQRCYLSYIHRAGQGGQPAGTGGIVVLTFMIQSSGKVTDAKMVRSDFSDQTLHSCVTEVVERVRFKTFKMGPVPVLEFPIVLQ